MKHIGRKEQYEAALDPHLRTHLPIMGEGLGLDNMKK